MKRMSRLLAPAGTALVALPVLLTGAAADASPGQLVTDASSTSAAALAASLVGDGIEVTGARISGAPEAIGSFSGMSAVGIDAGVALSTGRVSSLPGPYDQPVSSGIFGTPGDPDIEALVGARTLDAAILEFDFRPTTDSIAFTYVFGSMEYPEWVDTSFNDAFAFLIDGENCALVEGEPVSVDTINDHANTSRYVDNAAGAADTTLDGFTTPLTCAASVHPGEWNHAKLVIADTVDGLYDSAVLIAAHSFRANTAPTAADLSLTVVSGTALPIVYPGEDADGDDLTYEVVETPSHGDLTPTPTGAVYTPTPPFVGTDTFAYRVSDGITTSRAYTASIEVTPAAAVPTPTTPAPATPTPTPNPGTPTPTAPATPTPTAPATPAPSTPSPAPSATSPSPAPGAGAGDPHVPDHAAPSPSASAGASTGTIPTGSTTAAHLADTGSDSTAGAALAVSSALAATLAGAVLAVWARRRNPVPGNRAKGVHLSPRRSQN